MLHYVIIVLIIIVIISCQFLFYIKNIKKQIELQNIFPEDCSIVLFVQKDEENIKIQSNNQDSKIFDNITETINDYLAENKGAASDFHLVKDVVERNCESVEEEISTLTPIPLYMGLIGTMAGILVGVSFLVFTDGLKDLLNPSSEGVSGAGIIELLEGVALAMITSIIGILLTTSASYRTQNAKNILNRNKNVFLSWIQIKLLPILTGSTTSVIYTLQQNLSNFNTSFGKNVDTMEGALSTMSESYQSQVELINLLNQMDISQVAKANVTVLRELQRSTQEFSKFTQYLLQVGNYLESIEKLNSGLNEHLNRTQVIEEMGVFFKDEIEQIEQRKGAISQSVGQIDITMQKAMASLRDNCENQINAFIPFSIQQQGKLEKLLEEQEKKYTDVVAHNQNEFKNALDSQQELLKSEIQKATTLIEELKDLPAVKSSMVSVEEAMTKQASQISALVLGIERLTEGRSGANITSSNNHSMSIWLKLGIIMMSVIIGAAGLIYIISKVMSYVDNLVGR